jgi:hypothetical protein
LLGEYVGDGSEITSDNRPRSTLSDWFFDPLMVIKEQIKAENFTEEEEESLKMRVLLVGDPERIKGTLPHVPSLNERKKAEIDAFARRYNLLFIIWFEGFNGCIDIFAFSLLLQDYKESQNLYHDIL